MTRKLNTAAGDRYFHHVPGTVHEFVFLLLQNRKTVTKPISTPSSRIGEHCDFSRIRCPLCKWRPKPSHRWFCAPCEYPEYFAAGCGECWNTFSTRGRCPGCAHQWHWTACLHCAGWSLHGDWYEGASKPHQ